MESINEKTLFEVAEIQLSYRSKVKASLRPKTSSSKDAEKILRETWDSDKLELVELFKILLVNRHIRFLEYWKFLKVELQALLQTLK